jgi:hypothetical protein
MLNDGLIGAYLDGELDQEKRALVEHWLAHDKGAAARAERIRGADAMLRRAIPRIAVDQADPIAALIMEGPTNVVSFAGRGWIRRAVAIAAACVIGVLVGRASAPSMMSNIDPKMRLSAEIERALDALPSGQSAPIMGGELQMALSVLTDSGALCRQFRTVSGADAADALACRVDGDWRLAVQAAAPGEAAEFSVAAPAGSAIDAAISAMGGAAVLDANEERALIAARWRQ